MKIKAVVSDLDGTLTNYEGRYHEETPSLIKKLKEMSVYFSIATGKPYLGELSRIITELDISPLNIFHGGGMIMNWKTGEVPWNRPISSQSVKRILNYLNRNNVVFTFETNKGVYMRPLRETTAYTKETVIQEYDVNSIPANVLKIAILASLNRFSENDINTHIKNIESESKDIELTRIIFRGSFGLDITSGESTKHTAVLEYAKILGLHPHEMVAIGDGYNDYPLFTACGYKIAMGNAPKELKDIADKVVKPTNEGGMKEALGHIIKLVAHD